MNRAVVLSFLATHERSCANEAPKSHRSCERGEEEEEDEEKEEEEKTRPKCNEIIERAVRFTEFLLD